jgi:hypothetical protein
MAMRLCTRTLMGIRPLTMSSFSTVKEIKKGGAVVHHPPSIHSYYVVVGVVGLGLMGHGIAQVAAQAGYDVVALESNHDALDRGDKRIEDSLKKMIAKDVKKGKMTEVQQHAVTTSSHYNCYLRVKRGDKLLEMFHFTVVVLWLNTG